MGPAARWALGILLAGMVSAWGGVQDSSLPVVTCHLAAESPDIDGVLDDPVWDQATEVSLVRTEDGEPGRFSTRVRVLYDHEYLYVAFSMEDDYVWGTVDERDGPIWNEECVEVFINPGGYPHQYWELNVSPKNQLYDSIILNGRSPENPNAGFYGIPEWNPEGLKTGARIQGIADTPEGATGWTVEYAIPFHFLYGADPLPPQVGDAWRINFYRIDTPEGGEREHYAWSPTGRSAFHLPWKFGRIVFSGPKS